MRKKSLKLLCIVFALTVFSATAHAQADVDSTAIADSLNIDELVVTGTRVVTPRDQISAPISIVRRAAIEQSGETALMPILSQQVPGLFVTSRGISGYGVSGGAAGGISMRGFAGGSGRVLILIDGHPQYAAVYGHPVADTYIASDVERVEVSRGATSVLYGSNAMGGAINLITRKSLTDGNRLHARLLGGSYGSQKYMLNDGYKNGCFSFFAGGNYDRTDGHRANSAFSSESGMLKAGYEISNEWKASANLNLTHFRSENPGEESNPMIDGVASISRGMAAASLENNYGKTSGAANFYYNWGNHIIDDGYHAGGTPQPYKFHSTDYMGGVNLYQTLRAFKGNAVTAGFDANLYGGNAYRNPTTEIYADHKKLHNVAGYLFVQQEVWRFVFDAGIRLENHKIYGNEWVPHFGVSFKAAENTYLKFSTSKGFRTPNMRELYMYASANEDLLPEKSWSYDVSVTQRFFENRLALELNLFYTKGDNIVQVVQVGGRPQNQNVGNFINKGVEFSGTYQIFQNLSVNANYSYLHMNNIFTGAPRHKFYAGATYAPGKFTFSGGVQVVDKLYLSTSSSAQTSSYTLVDLRAAYRPAKWIEIFAKGDNILCRKYATMLGFPMPRAVFWGGLAIDL